MYNSQQQIYYFGGYCGHDLCFHNSLNELNISTLTWTQLQPTDDSITVMKKVYGGIMSSEQSGFRQVVVNKKVEVDLEVELVTVLIRMIIMGDFIILGISIGIMHYEINCHSQCLKVFTKIRRRL